MIRKLMQSIREFKLFSLLSPLFVVLEVVMEVVIPLLMAKLIDEGIDGAGGMDAVMHYGWILLVCCVLSLIFGALAGHFAAFASAGFARNLRHDMFYRVQKYSFSNIDKFSAASIVTRLTTDVTNVQNAYQMVIRIALRSPAMLIFSMVMAFRLSTKLSLIYLAAIPVLGVGLYFIMTRVHPIFERVFKTYDKLNNVTQENLHGIRVVKSFVREDHEIQKFSGISEDIYRDFSRAEKRLACVELSADAVLYVCLSDPGFLVRRKNDRQPDTDHRAAHEPYDICHSDSVQSDDAFYGIRYDYHFPCLLRAYRGNSGRRRRYRQPCGRCHRSDGRQHRL